MKQAIESKMNVGRELNMHLQSAANYELEGKRNYNTSWILNEYPVNSNSTKDYSN